MSTFEAFILGLIQGLTEFLPVSSTGHLVILQKAFGMVTEGDGLLVLNVLLHVGTLVAVLIVYWRRVWYIVCHPIQSELKWLVVATIPTVIWALTLGTDEASSDKYLAVSFYFTSLTLVAANFIAKQRQLQKKYHKEVRWYDAVGMGVMQAIGVLPAVSRSGSVIAGGLATGLTRKRAADFCFLMSIPAILGSVVLEGKDILSLGAGANTVPTGAILVGMLTAMVFGFLAIKFMLWVIRRISLNWFALYTFLLGTYLLVDQYILKGFMA